MNGEQGVELGNCEPQAGHLVPGIRLPLEAIAVVGSIVDNGCVKLVAKLGDEAFNGCLPALQILHEFRQGDGSSPVFQNGMKLLDTIEFIHDKP